MSRRVLLAVTHLLGSGHLVRTAAIGRALAARGHAVTLVSGGMPNRLVDMSGLDLVQLPPIRSEVGDFTTLRDEAGAPATADRLAARRAILLDTLRRTRPEIVVVELYPFGRRALAAEFEALIGAAEATRPRPLVACSVRDILVAPEKRAKIDAAHARLDAAFDAILVHGDPALVPLEASWPFAASLRGRVVYTGYVGAEDDDGRNAASGASIPRPAVMAGLVPAIPILGRDASGRNVKPFATSVGMAGTSPAMTSRANGAAEILVSGGASAASLPLYRAALAAAGIGDCPWHLLVGGGVGEADFRSLSDMAPPQATVERTRADFRALMRKSAVFVGQAGYNTIMDIVATQARSVLVPFEAGRETEQRQRADALAARGLVGLLPEAELDAARLAEVVQAAFARPRPDFAGIRLDGAARSAEMLDELAGRSRLEARVA